MVDLSKIGAGAVTGVAVGLLIGVLSRLSMRAVALLSGIPTSFSIEGTMSLILIGATFGVIIGTLFSIIRYRLKQNAVVQGAIGGAFLALLITILFLQEPTGELALTTPVVNIALFSPLPLVAGILLGMGTTVLEKKWAQRRVQLGYSWFALFLLSLALYIFGVRALSTGTTRLPRMVWDLYRGTGLSFDEIAGINAVLGLFFAAIFCGTVLTLMMYTSGNRTARLTAVALLLFMAGFVPARGLFDGMMDATKFATLGSEALRSTGLLLLLYALYVFPTGHFYAPWGGRLFWIATTGLALKLIASALVPRIAQLVTEPMQFAVVVLLFAGGLYTAIRRLQHATALQKQQLAGPIVALSVVFVWFVASWVATLIVTDLRLHGPGAPFVPLSVTLFLLPWLLIPTSLLAATVQHGLWSDPTQNLLRPTGSQ